MRAEPARFRGAGAGGGDGVPDRIVPRSATVAAPNRGADWVDEPVGGCQPEGAGSDVWEMDRLGVGE
jgi:hypothetical protein